MAGLDFIKNDYMVLKLACRHSIQMKLLKESFICRQIYLPITITTLYTNFENIFSMKEFR